ncbi:MAG TPA: pyridoxal-phosphate dependent enzyme [Polyangiaceae bacterium]|nr:pyridoxal-phosphate dependent enzyme [Polyangiaceae bacterium]
MQRPLFELFPRLEVHAGFSILGDFPTPVEPLQALAPGLGSAAADCYVKRDDLSSAIYGGNKVRTLEALFGQAQREGKQWVAATGAYGSNHAVATVLHGARLGFRCATLLFPQPASETARANLEVSIARSDRLISLPHWSCLPAGAWWFARQCRKSGQSALIMPPGGAIPRGCLGFLSAGLELGLQVQSGALPAPREVVLAVGSTCSTAGLLVGLLLATRLGIGFGARPQLVAVRVTPWPVTSPLRILGLAQRVAAWLRELSGDRVFEIERAELARGLEIDARELGRGYGRPTPAGLSVIQRAGEFAAALDTTYSAKSAAGLLQRVQQRPACERVFWSTKSSAPLPEVSAAQLERAPRGMRRWLEGQPRAHGRTQARG